MARSLRAHLLRLLLPPIAALLAVGAVVAYYPSMEPATEAYDQALVDIGIALGAHVRVGEVGTNAGYSFELPPAVEQVLRTDRYDTIYYPSSAPAAPTSPASPSCRSPRAPGPTTRSSRDRRCTSYRCNRRAARRPATCWWPRPTSSARA